MKNASTHLRQIISIVVILVMLFSISTALTACGSKGGGEHAVTFVFPEEDIARQGAEAGAALATELYIFARMRTEELIEYDLPNGNKDELSSKIDQTMMAWQVTSAAAAKAAAFADNATSVAAAEDPAGFAISSLAGTARDLASRTCQALQDTLFIEAYAAEENAATKWANEISKKFDSYPAGKQIKGLAEDLGVDAKTAYKQLQMAQDILRGDAEREEGDLNSMVEKSLIATRTACKTTLYVASTVSGLPTASALEVGCMVVGGVDTAVDIATTGSVIIRGQTDRVTLKLQDTKERLAPIASVAGGISFFSSGVSKLDTFAEKMGLLDKFNYVGDSLLDYCQDGKILGVKFYEQDDKTQMNLTEIDCQDKTREEVLTELDKLELQPTDDALASPLPDSEPAESDTPDAVTEEFVPMTAAEVVEEMEANMGGTWDEAAVETYFKNLENLMEQMSQMTREADSAAPADSDDSQLGQAVRYTMTTSGEDGLTDTFDADITLHEDGTMEIAFTPHAVVCNDDFTFSVTDEPGMYQHLTGTYDESTGEFTGMGDTGVEDNVWNWTSTILTFDMDAGTASGVMGSELEGLAASSYRTQITLTRQ